ncbi:MAG: hypothetical protein ACAH59_00930 [Pseudobdellovibrionaceae bacterium]
MLKSLQKISPLFPALFLLLNLSCSSTPKTEKSKDAISILSFNVENLFDTQHDEGKQDYPFLPLSSKKGNLAVEAACEKQDSEYRQEECLENDWTEDKLKLKMKRLADAVLSAPGGAPDILILQEVENLSILKRWNQEYLQAAGYQTEILIEGDDPRGIDVAVLSRLPLAGKPQLQRLTFTVDPTDKNWKKPLSRGILDVPLKLPDGQTLTVLGFHFPSQSNPLQQRVDAVNSLNLWAKSKPAVSLIVAGGDSNISAKEEAVNQLQAKTLSSQWKVSNLIGCKDCKGTEVHQGVWSFFDLLLFSPNLMDGKASYQVDPSSIQVSTEGKYQVEMNGEPARFNPKSSVGVSDHLPIYAELVPRK